MPGTYSQLLYHIVFSTGLREPWITASIAGRLYDYIGGIIRSEQGVLYDIGGIEDHLRAFFGRGVFAPKGRRAVARGGATPLWASRNPWSSIPDALPPRRVGGDRHPV